MERTSINSFTIEIDQIGEYIIHINSIKPVIDYQEQASDTPQIKSILNDLKTHYISFRRQKKVFDYKAIIISLYGLVEKYLEIWIKEYLESLSKIVAYDELDDFIKDEHFRLSMKLMSVTIDGRWGKYKNLDKNDILANLHNCIASPNSYTFNTDSFTIQSGNLKHQRIVDICKSVGIRLNDFLSKNQELNTFLNISQTTAVNTESEVLYNKINDLVDRRNLISHGSEDIDDLLDLSILSTYISFVEKYLNAIFETLYENFIRQEANSIFHPITLVHNVWRNSIIGFEIGNYNIRIDDPIIIKWASGRYDKATIISIEKNRVEYTSLTVETKTNITVEIDKRANRNCTFFLKKKVT